MRRYIFILICSAIAAAACSPEQEVTLGPATVSVVVEGAEEPLKLLYPAEKYLEYKVAASSIPDKSLVLDVALDVSLVEEYNRLHGTSYATPPAEICSFPKDQVILPRFNDISTAGTMVIHSEFLPAEGPSLLPVVVEKVTGKDDVKCEVLYIVAQRVDIPQPEKLAKTGWTMLYSESESPESYAGHNFVREDNPSSSHTGYAKDLIDGSYASIWSFSTRQGLAPFHFVIDLGKEYTIRHMALWAQRGENQMGDPENTIPRRQCANATIEFATTLQGDGMGDLGGQGSADWFGKESFGPEVLKNQISNTVYLSELRYARYVRFTYVNCYYAASDVEPRTTYNGGSMAELDLFGYDEKIEVE